MPIHEVPDTMDEGQTRKSKGIRRSLRDSRIQMKREGGWWFCRSGAMESNRLWARVDRSFSDQYGVLVLRSSRSRSRVRNAEQGGQARVD